MNRNFSRFSFAPVLTLTLFGAVLLTPQAHAQTHSSSTHAMPSNASPDQSVNGMGNSNQKTPANDLKNGISGNVPDAMPEDRTHGVNAPGRLIGPSPENGQPDPRFPNERNTSSGGGNESNSKSTASGNAQAPVSDAGDKFVSGGANGGATSGSTTSNLNEGLPSASEDNSGRNSGTGTGSGGAGGNAGGDANPGQSGAPSNTNNPISPGEDAAGALPFGLIIGVVVVGAVVGMMFWMRRPKVQR